MNAGRFAAAYVSLWAAHDLADHVVQTDHQAGAKSRDWRAMAGHIVGYGVTQALALGALHATGTRLRPSRVAAGMAVSLGTHAFLDRRWPVTELLRRTGSTNFATAMTPEHHHGVNVSRDSRDMWSDQGSRPLPLHGPYLADQSLHNVCVAIAAAIVSSGVE